MYCFYRLKPHSYGHICIPKYFFTHVYIYLGVQVLSYERNCSYANPAHVSKFAHGQDKVQIHFCLYVAANYLLLCVNLVV